MRKGLHEVAHIHSTTITQRCIAQSNDCHETCSWLCIAACTQLYASGIGGRPERICQRL